METTTDIFDELVAQKIEEAKGISLASLNGDSDPKSKKANPLLTVNELVKTRNEFYAREAELQQKEKELQQTQTELNIKKVEQVNEAVKNVGGFAISVGSTIAFGKWLKQLLAFEETGHMVTSAGGRTLLSCLKIFRR